MTAPLASTQDFSNPRERNSPNMKAATTDHLIRMELHMEQMIRMIANLNERIQVLEHRLTEPALRIVGK
ncbi:hypothetical protein M9R32_08540 [Paenisporosarcina quisquiliarum]|uniref:Uncharacterized protein n=1 Tax=Paenisporosarcina quisquiliarum TaxID=365346 RepID=A0A9X3RDM3_9BACL|nr:hypothetical protein [Paenisporosarcina quisquiliarum]MCZ8537224.1 hypothetical protein [Paenisporosarcina quisquiliarum]